MRYEGPRTLLALAPRVSRCRPGLPVLASSLSRARRCLWWRRRACRASRRTSSASAPPPSAGKGSGADRARPPRHSASFSCVHALAERLRGLWPRPREFPYSVLSCPLPLGHRMTRTKTLYQTTFHTFHRLANVPAGARSARGREQADALREGRARRAPCAARSAPAPWGAPPPQEAGARWLRSRPHTPVGVLAHLRASNRR